MLDELYNLRDEIKERYPERQELIERLNDEIAKKVAKQTLKRRLLLSKIEHNNESEREISYGSNDDLDSYFLSENDGSFVEEYGMTHTYFRTYMKSIADSKVEELDLKYRILNIRDKKEEYEKELKDVIRVREDNKRKFILPEEPEKEINKKARKLYFGFIKEEKELLKETTQKFDGTIYYSNNIFCRFANLQLKYFMEDSHAVNEAKKLIKIKKIVFKK